MRNEINLNNKYRVLLTEVLPYEIPLMLDNEGFYLNIQNEKLKKIFEETFSQIKNEWTIPFDYSVRKYAGDKSRKLSLIHPITQLSIVEFYEKYDYYMLSLCQNSPFSMRYINSRAKCIFNKEEDDDELNESSDGQPNRIEIVNNEIEKHYKSYFRYQEYDMIYKFFTGFEYLRLEQKFTNLMILDIASCFYHIYTHTICWAIKGKEQAKNLIGKDTFENAFDTLMQKTNYNETNGIVVGPEISRIFAEIILQKTDANVMNRLKNPPYSLTLGRDYMVRRYVDDHYIYANNKEILQDIQDVYKEELQYYKLFVNEKKTEFRERPFVSDVSDAKCEMNIIVSEIAKKWLLKKEDGQYIHNITSEMKVFTSIVRAFCSLSHRYHQKYGALNRYFLSILSSQIAKEINQKFIPNASTNLILMYTEVSFYIFSLDMNVSASIKLCRILELLHRWASNSSDKTTIIEIENKMHREVKRCIDIYETHRKKNETNLEIINLLLCLSRFMRTPLNHLQLMNIFNINENVTESIRHLNYFQICTILYLIEDDVNYSDLHNMIVEEANRRFAVDDAMRYADNAMLFFDLIVCPYIDKKEIKESIRKVYSCSETTYGKKYKEIRQTKRWFFNWDKSNSLSNIISKKEYHSPYE